MLRSEREIDLVREAGRVVAKALLKLQKIAEPGISTAELDKEALRVAKEHNAQALFLGVTHPSARFAFPGVICASVNHEVVHGIPSKAVVLKDGDILSVDFGVRLNGYCGDSAVTLPIGEISAHDRRLLDATRGTLGMAIESIAPGIKWSTVAGKMQKYAESAGFSVVREYVGHGIGREMHEEPKLQNFVNTELLADDVVLKEGMVLAVEPMINAGRKEVKTLKNGWTVVTKDGKKSAHFEHTVVVTSNGCEIMTVV